MKAESSERVISVGIYCRVSSEEQAREGRSLGVQEQLVRAYVSGRFPGATVRVYSEQGSGRKTRRREYQRMMRDARFRAIQAVGAVELSRLWRNAKDALIEAEKLRDWNCGLIVTSMGLDSTTAFGSLVFSLFAVLSQFESDQISERTKRNLAVLKLSGRKGPGRRPYGWRVGKGEILERVAAEQATADLVMVARDRGESWEAIAAKLNTMGRRTASGQEWSGGGLRLVLRSVIARRAVEAAREEDDDPEDLQGECRRGATGASILLDEGPRAG